MRIAFFGGTFNPIHIGHLISAIEIKEYFFIDKFVFIPTGIPPHKKIIDLSAKDRYDMVALSVAGLEGFEVSDIEINSKEISYTVDTIDLLKKQYKNDELFYCIGADAFLSIDTWKGYRELLNKITFIIITRPKYSIEQIKLKYNWIKFIEAKKIAKYPPRHQSAYIYYRKIDISSSQIRKRVKEKKTIRYFVPYDVEKMILEKRFYLNE
ncbi:MAG: nicotinate-nucleotide adenylyltransferase [Desulfurella sp.]|uniref:nicotinate-nucleotide adenylyltransferase n=1 Tax=Desulfurella sp. TaxID=1962857 RepID=UPI003D139A38